ncbi:restriction endonuclease subunit S [Veillonella sp. 20925_1_51]|uniref:restriction endonuclease subunit S n=1 Tax=Veillonella sp. 20925_1_51 TaxID=3003641 RepID=UPI00352E5E38
MMSKEKRRVPKLRFPGFTEDWEQYRFNNLLKKNLERNDGKFNSNKTISIARMKYNKLGNGASDESLNNYKVLRFGDIAFEGHENKEFKYGRFVMNDIGDGIMSPRFTALRPIKVLDVEFWKEYINYEPIMQKKLVNSTKKGTMMHELVVDEFLKQEILLPSKEEQQKIGRLLKLQSNIINLHQRKVEHLILKKKALLQKLFPRNGNRYPDFRFPGFTAPWEQRKLGSIGSTYTGLSGKTKESFGHGEAQYITYLNVFQNTVSDITMTDKVEIDTTQNEVKYGDVLFTTSSETPEEVGMSSVWLGHMPNIYLNSFCFGFRPNQKIDPYFLGYSLRAPYMRDKIKILAQGISRYNISKNKVMELEISLPNDEEQRLLGNFLRNIDLSITLHQRKLEHLQIQKKSLLQQLFV